MDSMLEATRKYCFLRLFKNVILDALPPGINPLSSLIGAGKTKDLFDLEIKGIILELTEEEGVVRLAVEMVFCEISEFKRLLEFGWDEAVEVVVGLLLILLDIGERSLFELVTDNFGIKEEIGAEELKSFITGG